MKLHIYILFTDSRAEGEMHRRGYLYSFEAIWSFRCDIFSYDNRPKWSESDCVRCSRRCWHLIFPFTWRSAGLSYLTFWQWLHTLHVDRRTFSGWQDISTYFACSWQWAWEMLQFKPTQAINSVYDFHHWSAWPGLNIALLLGEGQCG
jgi:hypothetical protein